MAEEETQASVVLTVCRTRVARTVCFRITAVSKRNDIRLNCSQVFRGGITTFEKNKVFLPERERLVLYVGFFVLKTGAGIFQTAESFLHTKKCLRSVEDAERSAGVRSVSQYTASRSKPFLPRIFLTVVSG